MIELKDRVIMGALGGLLAALMVDFDAWKSGDPAPFDWRKAIRRYVYSVLAGASLGVGVSGGAL